VPPKGQTDDLNLKGDLIMDWEEMYDTLRDVVGVPEEALDLAFGISGCNEETACAILNYYTGWKSFEGYFGEFNED